MQIFLKCRIFICNVLRLMTVGSEKNTIFQCMKRSPVIRFWMQRRNASEFLSDNTLFRTMCATWRWKVVLKYFPAREQFAFYVLSQEEKTYFRGSFSWWRDFKKQDFPAARAAYGADSIVNPNFILIIYNTMHETCLSLPQIVETLSTDSF